MEKLQTIWWEEEVNEKYLIIKRFNYSLLWMMIAIMIFQLLFLSEWYEITVKYLPFSLMHLLICLLIKKIEHRSVFEKSAFSIVLSEFNCALWWRMGRFECRDCEILLSILSFASINICEWPFIQSCFKRNIVLFKHFFIWHYYDYLSGRLTIKQDSLPMMVSGLVLLLCELHWWQVREGSYGKFLSRKSAENAEKRLNLIFNLFPDGILIMSHNGKILYSNANLARLLSCSLNQVFSVISSMEYCQGKKYSSLANSNRLIEDVSLIPNLRLNQEIIFGICKIGVSNLEWRGQKVLWEDQEAILLTVRDANQIIQLEQTVSDNKLKNVLLRSVSHELRTPINAIVALVDSLKEEIDFVRKENWKEKLDIISVSSQLLLSLVNDLLDYSRILAGVFSIQKSKFLFRNSIGNAIQLVKIQAEKKGLKLITRIDKDLPSYIFSDPLRLNQVLLNLLGNALKFTLKGYIEICCMLASKNKVKIIVTDTGIGIEETKMSTLFQEFNTSRERNLNPSGCGLGLFISNVIVQELGSRPIEVESKLHEGSSFSFIINISEENFNFDDPDSSYTDESILESTSPIWVKDFTELLEKELPQVLIVDDNDFNRFALGTILNNNYILFSEACTGKQAVKYVEEADERSRPYKVIIMDGCMPELNGWEAAKVISDMYYTGEISSFPIIIGYTAFSSDLEISKCIESGMKECIIKPCNAEILIQKISKYLSM